MTQTVVVAGGTGGLGRAVVAEFLEAGWRVVAPGRSEQTVERLGAHPALNPIVADPFDPAGVADVVALAASDESAPLVALVNLVGGFASGGRVHETPIEEFEDQLRINLRPTYLITQAVLPHLLAAGAGAIVCTASRSAIRPFAGAAGYIAAKAGVIAFADALHAEYAGDGIRVNTILPATIDTAANRAARPGADTSGWTPPEQIARVVRTLVETEGFAAGHLPV
ncbi:SDR family NAD(P)-dependent oxidoreductase [Kribbella sandramycini]|uniref:NAD(P)-dependent dehydrogenase (Short-subunit alcohol dehydrogenase family) n=1 Tax=Kribbella sandramycini TaxID=60450 RepID=A0A7Y4L4U8_9ACTN|nr:SDR family NAD(P)-dependent oxidoreductase [Kribbella sandramycini]MBB6571781.1 NAD(P)-dependent dehydrogenase (short-subunit alcohol dehydrogenase family) [Kribbella sandramycini]NOL44424.1 SDR family NAD(P)-dependent oxidoreductase [Kribbella sandramycini]